MSQPSTHPYLEPIVKNPREGEIAQPAHTQRGRFPTLKEIEPPPQDRQFGPCESCGRWDCSCRD